MVLLHPDGEALVQPTLLAEPPRDRGDLALLVEGALELLLGHRVPPEEGLAALAGDRVEVVAQRAVPAHAAHFGGGVPLLLHGRRGPRFELGHLGAEVRLGGGGGPRETGCCRCSEHDGALIHAVTRKHWGNYSNYLVGCAILVGSGGKCWSWR